MAALEGHSVGYCVSSPKADALSRNPSGQQGRELSRARGLPPSSTLHSSFSDLANASEGVTAALGDMPASSPDIQKTTEPLRQASGLAVLFL